MPIKGEGEGGGGLLHPAKAGFAMTIYWMSTYLSEISEKVKKGPLSGEYIFFGNSAWRSESLALSKKIS